MGPVLFSLAIHSLARELVSTFNVWYLDDGTLGGSPQSVLADFTTILEQSSSLGLSLNLSKCEAYIAGASSTPFIDELQSVAPGVRLLDSSEVTLLGSPITLDALLSSFESKLGCIQTLSSHLETLFAHDAFYLLRHCFAIPKLLYLLRTSPSWRVPGLLEKFDELICTSLQTFTNINISSSAWAQSILPAAKGGLGIRSAIDLSLPSYLYSLHSTSELVSSILTPSGLTFESSLLHEALDQWSTEYPMPPEDRRHYPRSWDELLYEHHFSSLGLCL